MKTVLFVCTGNVCRSPMAEGLLRHALRDDPHVRVLSAGLGALDGQPATDASVDVMAELGIDIAHHRSQALRVPLVEAADFIFTMTRQQQDTIQAIYPMAAEKTFLLREFENAEVIGKDQIRDGNHSGDNDGCEHQNQRRTRFLTIAPSHKILPLCISTALEAEGRIR